MIVYKSEQALRTDVVRELEWDSRVDAANIGVAVSQRVVTLTGRARSYAEKIAAQRAAHRVPGVLDVANDIQVLAAEEMSRTDTELAKAVRHTLEWDVLVPDQRIASTVADGCVTLEGTVDLLRERHDAERAVRGLTGVREMHNKLVVETREVDPATVRRAIESALERHACHEAKRIVVDVDDGVVTLSGEVDSWAEKRAVLGLVSHTPGVRAVHDRLTKQS
jgi:osmotically-inducible protein OsmY